MKQEYSPVEEHQQLSVINPTFSLETFKKLHPKFSTVSLCNFNEEQINYLVQIVEEIIGTSYRGKRQKFRRKINCF